MSNLSAALLIGAALSCLWYGAGTLWIMRKRGFDPALLTYLTPFPIGSYTVARVMMLIVVIAALVEKSHPLLILVSCAILLEFAVAHLLLLILFNRTGTQPMFYYGLLVLSGSFGVFGARTMGLVPLMLILTAAQEISLRHWLKNRAKCYNRWVAGKVRRIHRAYSHLVGELTDREWFYVLHFAVTESIARPRLSRLVERLYFHLKHPDMITSGIMQVKADKLLSDHESMSRGSQIVRDALHRMPDEITEPLEQLKWLAQAYNGSLNATANADYTGYLLATYPGLLEAWESLEYESRK